MTCLESMWANLSFHVRKMLFSVHMGQKLFNITAQANQGIKLQQEAYFKRGEL